MTAADFAVIGASIFVTSFIAGVFGMAGGMILLGVLLLYFDVATAMVVFSLLQLSSNLSRVFLWRAYILWPIFFLTENRQGAQLKCFAGEVKR